MQEYLVIWRIEVSAENAREAAEVAQKIMRDPASLATSFICLDENDQSEIVDLMTAQ